VARHRAPEVVPVRHGEVPAWLREGPVGDEPLSALLAFARRREEWLRASGMTRRELNRLVRTRGPRTRDDLLEGV
jgi:hypothetical protein